jgi:predicted MFS family arabinose efflux permease
MKIGLNKVIKVLITSDFLLQAGWGLIGPIFAIFITRHINGGSVAVVGFISATYWVTKSVSQLFIGHFVDAKKGEQDDFKFLIGGMFIANLIPLGYLFSTEIVHIFILEFIRGLAMACVLPCWAGIFTRHINKGWEAFSWSIDSTGIGLAFGLAAALGGFFATILGFESLFVLVAILGLSSTFILFLIKKNLLKKNHFPPTTLSKEEPF